MLHLDVSTLQSPVPHLNVFPLQGPELHQDVSTPQSPMLYLDVSTSFSLRSYQVSNSVRFASILRSLGIIKSFFLRFDLSYFWNKQLRFDLSSQMISVSRGGSYSCLCGLLMWSLFVWLRQRRKKPDFTISRIYLRYRLLY